MLLPKELIKLIPNEASHIVKVRMMLLNNNLRNYFINITLCSNVLSINKIIISGNLSKLKLTKSVTKNLSLACRHNFITLFNELKLKRDDKILYQKLLNIAAENNNLSIVRKIIKMYEFDNNDLSNALKWSAYHDHINIVIFLIKNGALINDEVKNYVLEGNALNVFKYLIDHKLINVNVELLNRASSYGHYEICKTLVNYLINYNEAFIIAATHGHLPLIKLFLTFGADIHAQNDSAFLNVIQIDRARNLHHSNRFNLQIAMYLLKKGCNYNVDKGIALIKAINLECEELVNELIERDIQCKYDIIVALSSCKNMNIVKKILSKYNINYEKLFTEAIVTDNFDLVDYLIQMKIDFTINAEFNLKLLMNKERYDLVKILLDNGASINSNLNDRHAIMTFVIIILIVILILSFFKK
jgi:hypothetical protein